MKSLLTSWPIRLNLLAVAAVVTAVAFRGEPLVPLALALVVFGVDAWKHGGIVASLRVPRTLAALGAVIAVWYTGGTERLPLLAAGMALTLFFAYADVVSKALHIGYLETVNFDIVRSRRRRWSRRARRWRP